MDASLNSTQIRVNWKRKTKSERESECGKKNTRISTCIMLIYRPRFGSIRFFRIGALFSQWDSLCLAAGVCAHVCVLAVAYHSANAKRRGINQMPCTQIVPRIHRTWTTAATATPTIAVFFSRSLQFQVVFGIWSSFFYYYSLFLFIRPEQSKATT